MAIKKKSYNSLMNNVSCAGEKYGARFIHAAIKSLSKKKAVHMQALECRLWLSGLVMDPETRADVIAFSEVYFAPMKQGTVSGEELECFREEYRYFCDALKMQVHRS